MFCLPCLLFHRIECIALRGPRPPQAAKSSAYLGVHLILRHRYSSALPDRAVGAASQRSTVRPVSGTVAALRSVPRRLCFQAFLRTSRNGDYKNQGREREETGIRARRIFVELPSDFPEKRKSVLKAPAENSTAR